MSEPRTLVRAEAMALQTRLLEVFRLHNLDVSVGITANGVSIGSQDERVNACNLGEVRSLGEELGTVDGDLV